MSDERDTYSFPDFRVLEELTPGNSGCEILLVDIGGEKRVVKQAILPEGIAEIQANLIGYMKIGGSGGSEIIPKPTRHSKEKDIARLEMPYLGTNLTERLKAGESIDWEIFWRTAGESALAAFDSRPFEQSSGISEYIALALPWLEKVEQSFSMVKASTMLANIPVSTLAGTGPGTLMLMDFTPDNLFLNDDKVTFIDPWVQGTYRGSFLMSIGQFDTLINTVYGHALPPEYYTELDALRAKLQDRMGLSDIKAYNQQELGRAMQFALSALVRVKSDPDQAKKYYLEALASLDSIT